MDSRPFLKWAGGKQWLVDQGISLPKLGSAATYYEPFAGAAALFFSLRPSRAVLSDSNSELIATYRAVRDNVDAVISELSTYKNTPEQFARIRSSSPTTVVERAARLIYLNKTAFNGIYRVNKQGVFNVPFGKYENPTICAVERLRAASSTLKNARLRTLDYRRAVKDAKRGDLVYFDPPYVTGHNNNGFIKYNAHLFAWSDQETLAALASALRTRGVHVVVSNAAHQAVLDLYGDFYLSLRSRHSLIGGKESTRGVVQEVLITSFAH